MLVTPRTLQWLARIRENRTFHPAELVLISRSPHDRPNTSACEIKLHDCWCRCAWVASQPANGRTLSYRNPLQLPFDRRVLAHVPVDARHDREALAKHRRQHVFIGSML